MFKSKAIKEGITIKGIVETYPKSSKLYMWWIQTRASTYYYDFVHNFITNPIFQVKRLYQWYVNVFRFDYDFDGHCLFAIIEYKLKRVKAALDVGHAVQEDRDMKALRLAIKLAGRLAKENYDEPFYTRHEKKWGELKTWFEPCEDRSGHSYWRGSRPNANTPEEKEQERKEHLASMCAAQAKMEREQKWFFDILNKYLRGWWD